jgi:RNA polymerase sigma-70 factor (ECF subfamily)
MSEHQWLAEQFNAHRGHLRAVAYRMLGSLSDADDAVQEAWLKVSRADVTAVENLGAWLTTVVARACLDLLRARKSRREDTLDAQPPESMASSDGANPEQEALLADSVGLALLVVLDTLDPAERLAFVLHDMFGMPFDEIAPIVGRSTDATRQLASRARRRVRGAPTVPGADLTGQREVVEAFLSALRGGDFEGLLAVLDPDVVVRVDAAAGAPGGPREIRGALTWAEGAIAFSRGATGRMLGFAQPALVNGTVGLVLAPRGRLWRALRFAVRNGRIVEVDVVADPTRLQELEVAVLNG